MPNIIIIIIGNLSGSRTFSLQSSLYTLQTYNEITYYIIHYVWLCMPIYICPKHAMIQSNRFGGLMSTTRYNRLSAIWIIMILVEVHMPQSFSTGSLNLSTNPFVGCLSQTCVSCIMLRYKINACIVHPIRSDSIHGKWLHLMALWNSKFVNDHVFQIKYSQKYYVATDLWA